MEFNQIITTIEEIIASDKELIEKYFHIGKIIDENNKRGSRLVEKLAAAIDDKYSEGYSKSNLYYMQRFYRKYADDTEMLEYLKHEDWTTNIEWLKKDISKIKKDISKKRKGKKQDQLILLKTIGIKNFNGIVETNIDNIPEDVRWIFLVSENGYGKSSVLQAIYLGLCGTTSGNINLITERNKVNKKKPVEIEIGYKQGDKKHIHTLKNAKNSKLENVLAYGANRLNFITSSTAKDKTSAAYNLFNTDGLLFDIQDELKDWKKQDKKKFNAVKKILLSLLEPYIIDIEVETGRTFSKGTIVYSEADTATKQVYQKVTYNQLASGFKSIIAMFGDMLYRFSALGQDITRPESLKGIVLIDEFELYWHPKLQKSLLTKLDEMFVNLQFILATHSIATIMATPKNSIFFKEERSKEDGITINQIKLDTQNMSPNILMSSPLLDMPLYDNLADFPTHKDYMDWLFDRYMEEFSKSQMTKDELIKRLNAVLNE